MSSFWRKERIPALLAAVFAATGFVNLVTGILPAFGVAPGFGIVLVPDYLRLTPVQKLSGLVSVVLGILMIAVGRGLYRRRRSTWTWALVLLTLLMANNLYRGTTPQTGILSGALIAALVVFRRRFDVRSDSRLGYGQVIALVSVLFALSYGIVGSHAMRAEFQGLETWTDAVYYTFVTYSTLGYGDILPKTADARLFAVSMIIVGLGSFVTAMTMVVGPMIEQRMKGVLSIMGKLKGATDHVIVCGYSNVGESVVDELQGSGVPYVIIDDRADIAAHLRSKGHDVVEGDATRRQTLKNANVRGARAVVATADSDSVNTLVTITAKELREELPGARFRIVTRVEDEENIDKAHHVGADKVVSPSTIGGRTIAREAAGGVSGGDTS